MIDTKILPFEDAQVASKEAEKTTPKKKVRRDFDSKIIATANRGFRQIPADLKTNDLKKAFLLNAAESLDDEQLFFGRFMARAAEVRDELADRKSVTDACAKKGIDLMDLATHVVFMGKTKTQQVLKYGLGEKSPIYNQLDLFGGRFMPDDPQDFISKSWKPSEHPRKKAVESES